MKLWLWALAGIGAVFRYHALFANSFHSDEALFASFARTIAVWQDPLLRLQPVDKPPLLFYGQALFYPLMGPVEWVARLPNFVAFVLLIPVVGIWAWQTYRDVAAAVSSSIIIALAPLAIQFSATAFTDPLLTLFVTTALMMAGKTQKENGPVLSAILFGLAVLTKHQAWLFFPLLAALSWLNSWSGRHWRRWLAVFSPFLILLVFWTWLQSGSLGFQLWSTQISNFGGLRPSWSWEIGPRGAAWGRLWQQAWGSSLMGGLILLLLIWAGIRSWRRQEKTALANQLLLLFILGYLLLHWFLAIPIWDRYLLPLMPLIALVCGYRLAVISHQLAGFNLRLQILGAGLFFLLLLPGAWDARNSRFPIGGQPGADQGAGAVAAALADADYGTVLYDHWFSWQWRYHLFDGRVYLSWFPHPAALLEELAVFGHDGQARYLALPDSAVARPVERAVTNGGFQLQRVPLDGQTPILLYRIIPAASSTFYRPSMN